MSSHYTPAPPRTQAAASSAELTDRVFFDIDGTGVRLRADANSLYSVSFAAIGASPRDSLVRFVDALLGVLPEMLVDELRGGGVSVRLAAGRKLKLWDDCIVLCDSSGEEFAWWLGEWSGDGDSAKETFAKLHETLRRTAR